jgi:hypothetical protein
VSLLKGAGESWQMTERTYTAKQMGDAGEMLVAAELTLHGIPALRLPENWPHYDIIAQPPDSWIGYRGDLRAPQKISVKPRTFAKSGKFETRRVFIVPGVVAHARSYEARPRSGRGFFVHRLVERPPSPFPNGKPVHAGGWGLADYENNFGLSAAPAN